MENKNFNRRQFLSCGAMIGAAGMVAPAILSSCGGGAKEETGYTPLKAPGEYYVPELPDKAIEGKALKAGVIGCGGRGTGAILNLLDAADGITVVALGDVEDIVDMIISDNMGYLNEGLIEDIVKEVIKNIEVYGEMHRYIPYLAKNAGYTNIGEKVVIHRKRQYGVSKFGLERFVNGYLDLFSLYFLDKFGKQPMHFFGVIPNGVLTVLPLNLLRLYTAVIWIGIKPKCIVEITIWFLWRPK